MADGIRVALKGMLRSSVRRTGTRALIVENIRYPTRKSALVDCRYEIQNQDGSARKMWSTFIMVKEKKDWKITAIRNMLPAK